MTRGRKTRKTNSGELRKEKEKNQDLAKMKDINHSEKDYKRLRANRIGSQN